MKKVAIVCVLMNLVCLSTFAQSLAVKHKLNKTLRLINKGNATEVPRLLSRFTETQNWKPKEILKKDYATLYMTVLSLQIPIDSLPKDSLLKLNAIIESFIVEWDSLGRDTVNPLKKGIKITEIREKKYRIENAIAKIDNDSILSALRDSIAAKDSMIALKRQYEECYDLDTIAKTALDLVNTNKIPPQKGSESTDYVMEFKRGGSGGKDLYCLLTIYVKDDLYGYPLGYYQSDAINYPIKIFSTLIKSRLTSKAVIVSSISGEADCYEPGDSLIYYGEYGDTIYQDSTPIIKGQKITNEQLAFLRAYNAKDIFQTTTHRETDTLIAIDHLAESSELKGYQYRKIVMTVCIVNYYADAYNKLSTPAQKSVNVRPKTVVIDKDHVEIR